MDFAVVGVVAFGASFATLFSGFGLGTLLLPAFALFFPVEMAVAATAVVHLANNLLKLSIFGRRATWAIVLRFGLPALAASFGGAALLTTLSGFQALETYDLFGHRCSVTPVKLVFGALMLAFAVLEIHPRFATLRVPPRYLPLGGIVSGFFGGLSGHQGAFRSAFLAKSGIAPAAFIGTNVVIACMVDVARLSVYGASSLGGHFRAIAEGRPLALAVVAMACAFTGVVVGNRLVKKVTIRAIQIATAAMLVLLGIGLGAGVLA